MDHEKNLVENFFGDPTGKGSVLCLVKREGFFGDQQHDEEYSVNFGELFFAKIVLVVLGSRYLKTIFCGLPQKVFENPYSMSQATVSADFSC